MHSNVTHVRFKIAIISGDISALIGSAGQSFCADLQIYAAIPAAAPRDTDPGTDDFFHCLLTTVI